MKKTVLVTGGAGYIGSALVYDLANKGHQVVALDNLSTGQRGKVDKRAEFCEGDIHDTAILSNLCKRYRIDTVIHCAGKKAVGESEHNPVLYFQTNVAGTISLLSAMVENDIPHIIFSSTASVYKPPVNNQPVSEYSDIEPLNVYGHTKLIAEHIIKEFVRTKKIKCFTIFRYFNVAGDSGLRYIEENAQNVFPAILQALHGKKKFSIYGTNYDTADGTGVRDYIHLKDLVSAHMLALQEKESHIYNLGTGVGYSVKELLKTFEDVTSCTVPSIEAPPRLGDPAVVTADSGKARKVLGWEPQFTMSDIVKSICIHSDF